MNLSKYTRTVTNITLILLILTAGSPVFAGGSTPPGLDRAFKITFSGAKAPTTAAGLIEMSESAARLKVRLVTRVSGDISPKFAAANYSAVVRAYEAAIEAKVESDPYSRSLYCLALQYLGNWGEAQDCLSELGKDLSSRQASGKSDSCFSLSGAACVPLALPSSTYHMAMARLSLATANLPAGVAYAREAAAVTRYTGGWNKGAVPWSLSQYALALALNHEFNAADDIAQQAIEALGGLGRLSRSGVADDTYFNLAATYIAMGQGASAWSVAQNIGVERSLSRTIAATGVIATVTLASLGGPSLLAAVATSSVAKKGVEMDALWKRGAEVRRMFVAARSALVAGAYDDARPLFSLLKQDPLVRAMSEIYPAVLDGAAQISVHDGDTEAAIADYRIAVDVIETARGSFHEEAGRMGFVLDKQGLYFSIVELLVSTGKDREAFAYAERAKARVLVDLLASRAPTLLHRQTEETRKILGALEEGMTAIATFNPVVTGDVVDRARGVVIEQRAILERSAPAIASLLAPAPVEVANIQSALLPDETLVEYFGENTNWFAFAISRDRVQAIRLDVDDLQARVSQYRDAVQDVGTTDHLERGDTLYKMLLGPLEPYLSSERLTIVPHGVLHYLPWAALPTGGNYLIDRFVIRTLPVAAVLPLLPQPASGTRTLLLGNPDLNDSRLDLPGAQREVEAIGQSKPNATIRLRHDASESFLKLEARGYDVVHIASHGVFDNEHPMESALLLSSDSDEDGNLSVGELYGLELSPGIVTLSACETGLGADAGGDDVVGLSRGLFYAGSASIVASLWQVDDASTAVLMQAMYAANTSNWATSLRVAQQQVRDSGYGHPYYWAPFGLSGRW